MLRSFVRLVILTTALFYTGALFAADFNSTNYDVYLAPAGPNSTSDLYLHSKDQIILLHGDIVTPIVIPPDTSYRVYVDSEPCPPTPVPTPTPTPDPNAQVPLSGSVASFPNSLPEGGIMYCTVISTDAVSPRYSDDQIASLALRKLVENKDFFWGDFNGDGKQDLISIYGDNDLLYVDGNIGTANGISQVWFGPRVAVEAGSLASFPDGKIPVHAPTTREILESIYSIHSGNTTFVVEDYNHDGVDDLVVYGDNDIADTYFSLKHMPSVSDYSFIFSFSHTFNIEPNTVKASSVNGASTGSFRVGESGAATYSIPLSLPAGTAGVAPTLGLSYSSQAGNGVMGHGWSLNGLSSIARCPKTLSQDGEGSSILWSADSPYCFQGQRLRLVSSNSTTRTYRTEIDQHTRIIAHGSDVADPEYFTLEAKDGSLTYYGGGSATQHRGGMDTGLSWSIKTFYDSVGNKVEYTYDQDYSSGYDFHLSKIEYAYGDGATPNSEIELQYKDRLDHVGGYVSGSRFKVTKRLTNIIVKNKVDGELEEIRSYGLHYRRQSLDDLYSLSYLTEIQECDGSGADAKCLKPTVFDWSAKQSFDFDSGSAGPATRLVTGRDDIFLGMMPMDINGDGHMDMVWYENDEYHHDYVTRVYFGIYDPVARSIVKTDFGTNGGTSRDKLGFGEDLSDGEAGRIYLHAIDYNADGRQDLAIFRDRYDHWEIHISGPNGFDENGKMTWALDDDPIIVGDDVGYSNAHYIIMDANSDGLQDIVTNEKIYLLKKDMEQPSGSATPYKFDIAGGETIEWVGFDEPFTELDDFARPVGTYDPITKTFYEFVQAGDFNGDGVGDAIVMKIKIKSWDGNEDYEDEDYRDPYIYGLREEHYYIATLEGNRFIRKRLLASEFQEVIVGGEHRFVGYGRTDQKVSPLVDFFAADINADGYFDLIKAVDLAGTPLAKTDLNSGYEFYLNNGDAFSGSGELTGGELIARVKDHDGTSFQFLDYNTDGYMDLSLVVGQGVVDSLTWNNTLGSFSDALEFPYSARFTTNRSMYFDITGDGRVDRLFAWDGWLRIFPNLESSPVNLITGITNGLGGETDIDYELMSVSDHYISVPEGFDRSIEKQFADCPNGGCENLALTPASFSKSNFYRHLEDPFADYNDAEAFSDTSKLPVMEAMGAGWIVTKVSGSAPKAHATDPEDVDVNAKSQIQYFYQNSRFQAGGRGLLGFQQLMTFDVQSGIKTATTYRQDWPFAGHPSKTESFSPNGDVMSRSETTWGLVGWSSSWETTLSNSSSGSAVLSALRPYLKQNIDTSYSFKTSDENKRLIEPNNSVLQSVTTTNKYDNFDNPYDVTTVTVGGNLTLTKRVENAYDDEHSYGSITENGTSIDFDTDIQSAGSVIDRSQHSRALGRLTGTRVTTARVEGDVSALSDAQITALSTVRESRFTYFTSGVHAGLIEKEISEPNQADFKVEIAYGYDPRGNKVRSDSTARNHQFNFGGIASSSEEQTRTQKFEYDSTYRYVDNTITVLGGDDFTKAVVSERNKYGSPILIKSAVSNLETTIDYDVMGREIYRADNADSVNNDGLGSWSQTEFLTCTSSLECPAGTSYVVRKTTADRGLVLNFYDKIGRVTRTATKSFDGIRFSLVDIEFDMFGRTLRASEPYFKGGTRYWTENSYDVLGRVVETKGPKEGVSFGNFYDGYSNTFINPAGLSRTETKNGFGELVEVQEPHGARNTYHYDSRGNLEYLRSHPAVEDLSQNIVADPNQAIIETHISFDSMGRKTAMSDPDKGNWQYAYNAFGELSWQKDGNGNVVIQSYDASGRMVTRTDYSHDYYTSLTHSNKIGHTRWYYDGYTDASPTIRVVNNALMQVSAVVMSKSRARETCEDSSYLIQCVYPSYDNFGRPEQTEVKNRIDTYGIYSKFNSYTTATIYDHLGRVSIQTDAADGIVSSTRSNDQGYDDGTIKSGIQNHYSETTGYLTSVSDLQTNKTIFTLASTNARGQALRIIRGNGLTSENTYEASTGRITHQVGNFSSLFTVQNINYKWDDLGNLTWRHNRKDSGTNRSKQESFCYDQLNRLVKTNFTPSSNKDAVSIDPTTQCEGFNVADHDMRYDSRGNITYKHDVGSYAYAGVNAGPHAVTSTSAGDAYEYDSNGNMLSSTGTDVRHITYTRFDKPSLIVKGDESNPEHATAFKYGIDRGRYWREDVNKDGVVTKTEYIGSVERITKSTEPGKVQWKRYLGKTAIITLTTDSSNNLLTGSEDYKEVYVYSDHLGSLDVITDAAGSPIQSLSFNAWGGRRDGETWSDHDLTQLFNNTSVLDSLIVHTTRGFTGHEMLDEVGIIHMNGRIYDPRLARFLQADPILQAPTSTQNLNRYSYTLNNPLNATDPSGFVHWKEVQQGLKQVVAIVIAVVAAIVCQTCAGPVLAAVMAMASAIGAAINGASGSGILRAAVAGAVMSFVPGGPGWNLGKAAVSGVLGGIASMIQGGKFGHGFASAAVSSGLGPALGKANPAVRVGVKAMVGGTMSEATGGKFANGAAGALISAVMSEGMSGSRSKNKTDSTENTAKTAGGLSADGDQLVAGGGGSSKWGLLTRKERAALLWLNNVSSDDLWEAYQDFGDMNKISDPQLRELVAGLSTNKIVAQIQVQRIMTFMEPDVQIEWLQSVGTGAVTVVSSIGGSSPIIRKMLEAGVKVMTSKVNRTRHLSSNDIISFYAEQYNLSK